MRCTAQCVNRWGAGNVLHFVNEVMRHVFLNGLLWTAGRAAG